MAVPIYTTVTNHVWGMPSPQYDMNISLIINKVEHLFMFYCPLGFPLQWNAFLFLLPIFLLDYLSFLLIHRNALLILNINIIYIYIDFPGGSDRKVSCLQCRRPGFDPWVGKILWRRKWQPTPVLLPGKSHGQRSMVGYSPQGRKESDTTERLHFHFHIYIANIQYLLIKIHSSFFL